MLYHFYEMNHAAMAPWRTAVEAGMAYWDSPANPFAQTPLGRSTAASLHMFERMTRRYGKPDFGITETLVGSRPVAVHQDVIWQMPFCNLIHFRKDDSKVARNQQKLLIVAPMSGHYATLLRNTVEAMLPAHDVYITDWADARNVPLAQGRFDSGCRDPVAFINDDLPIFVQDCWVSITVCDGLPHDEVDGPAAFASSTSKLTDLLL